MKPLRDVAARAEKFLSVWNTLLGRQPILPESHTYEAFAAAAGVSADVRERLERLKLEERALLVERRQADARTNEMLQSLVFALRVREREPAVAGFLSALGYIPKARWRTGRVPRRRRNAAERPE